MKLPRSAFRYRYHALDAIWADCYIGYQFVAFGDRAPTKDAVLAWFREHQTVQVFAVPGCGSEQLHMEDRALREVAMGDAAPLVETMIQQAVHYGSNESLPPGEARELATLFLSEFETPLVLTNFWLSHGGGQPYVGSLNRVVAGYGYSCEAFLCCVDRRHMGFMLSIENE